jgi:uncharacterized repeat protein (TIGR01451 family)
VSNRVHGPGGSRRRRLHLTSAAALLIGVVLVGVFGVAAASGRIDPTTGSGRLASTQPARAGSHALPSSKIFRSLLATGTIGTAAGFEDNDGNLVPETLTDWNSFAPAAWTGTAPYQTATGSADGFKFLGLTDAQAVTSDTGFAGGVKQNDVCPSVIGSKAQNKDDLARAYIASKTVGTHVYLEIAWVRIPQNTVSADAHIAFEFNQSKTACANNDGLVQRTDGDLLLLYDFQSGTATISIETWSAADSAWSAPVSLTDAGTAEATVNTADVTDALAPGGPETLGPLEFGEAGIDLTAAFLDLSGGGRACEQFGDAHIFSRSSGSGDTSQLQDLVGPTPVDLSNCASPDITTGLSATTGTPGATVHDTATLTGATAAAGGSVTYTVYTDSACTTGAIDAGTKTVTNGIVPQSNTITFNTPGDFYWQAAYSGDDNNNPATSTCTDEHLVINKLTPTVATDVHDANGIVTSAPIGSTVHDVATVSGTHGTPTGSVTFTLYSGNSTCQGTGTDSSAVNLVAGSASSGNATVPVGGLSYIAHYSGDATYLAGDGPCEPLTATKLTPTVATDVHNADGVVTSAPIGSTVHDVATVSGAQGTPTGSVTFTVYSGNTTCQGDGTTSSAVNLVAGSAASGNATVPVGGLSYIAHYSGDATYLAGEGPCEPLAATKLTPTVVTDVHNADGVVTSVPIGSTVHDVATVSGTQGTPTGSVTFTLFSGNTTCQGEGSTSDSIDLVDGSAASGDATVPVGGLSYIAHYSGDATYLAGDGPCEPLAAGKLSPTIATTLSDTEVLVGSTVHDSATLSGATSDAGGTVTYTVYSDINCTQNPQDAGTADVSGGDVGNSNGIQFNNAGDFYWQAVYSGDDSNNGATSPCNSENNEHLLVDSPSISITKNPKAQSINSGGTANFTITVTNTGTTTLTNVTVTDAQAPGCANSAIGTLTAGQSTSYNCSLAGVTSSFTNSATATGTPPVGPNVTATDTAPVTVNPVIPPPPAPPAPTIDLSITKTGAPNPATVGNQVTWTMVVTNNGPSGATGVTVADPVPAGTTFVSVATTQGTCTGGAAVSCQLGSMAAGSSVTITLVTLASTKGTLTNTATTVGNEAETNTANNTATASVVVNGAFVPTPPVRYCTAINVAPKRTLFVGRKTTLTLKVTQNGKAVAGIRIRIKGASLSITTGRSNAKGLVKVTVKPKRAGILSFAPVSSKGCANPRLGVTGVFTPPVTG